jgi:hypothetical protein
MSSSAAVFWRIVGAIVWLTAQKGWRRPAKIQNDLAILCVCNGLAVSHRH